MPGVSHMRRTSRSIPNADLPTIEHSALAAAADSSRHRADAALAADGRDRARHRDAARCRTLIHEADHRAPEPNASGATAALRGPAARDGRVCRPFASDAVLF